MGAKHRKRTMTALCLFRIGLLLYFPFPCEFFMLAPSNILAQSLISRPLICLHKPSDPYILTSERTGRNRCRGEARSLKLPARAENNVYIPFLAFCMRTPPLTSKATPMTSVYFRRFLLTKKRVLLLLMASPHSRYKATKQRSGRYVVITLYVAGYYTDGETRPIRNCLCRLSRPN